MQTAIPVYLSSAGNNQVVISKPGKLMGILVGKDVATATIDIADHASSGSTNVIAHYEGSTLMTQLKSGVMFGEGIDCNAGITVSLGNQTNVTILIQPVGRG